MAEVARPWILELDGQIVTAQRYFHSKVLQDWEGNGGLAQELSLEEATDLAQRIGDEFMSTDEKAKIQSSTESLGLQEFLYSITRDADGFIDLTVFEDDEGCTVHLSSDMAIQMAELLLSFAREGS